MNRTHRPTRTGGRALLASALAVPALVAATCLATPAFAAAGHPDGPWSSQGQVPSAASSFSPSEATSGSTWYVAYTTSSGGIKYDIHTTGWWPKIRSVSGTGVTPSTSAAPSIMVFNNDLYVFWINSAGTLRYTDLVGSTWQPTQSVMGTGYTALSTAAPSLAVASDELWIAYKGHSSGNIYYTETGNGTTWGSQETAMKSATNFAPTIAPTGLSAAPLAFAWTESNGDIGYGILGFLGFENIGNVPSANTNEAPALAFMSAAPNGTMYVAWKGTNTKGVFFNEVANFSDSSFGPSTWTGQAALPGQYTSAGPALAVSGTTLYAVYTARSSTNVYYESATTPTS
jgi:hypothetical protein